MRLLTAFILLMLPPVLAISQELLEIPDNPRVRVVTTLGSFVIELNSRRAPLTTETIFHRVIQGFVAQTGGFTMEKPSGRVIRIDEEFSEKPTERTVVNESGNGLSNLRGTVGLARTNDPHSGGSQFYINLEDNLDLNPRPTRWGFTVFGTVVEGMETVDEIGHQPTGAAGQFERNVPVEPIFIERVELLYE